MAAGVALLSALTLLVSSADARQRLTPLRHSRLGTHPSVVIHDTVLPSRHVQRRAIRSAAYGGGFNTADGTRVIVYMSPSYVPNASFLQSVANFFDGLYHGAELAHVVIYLAPESEIHLDCASNQADSCFNAYTDTIYLVGTPPSDGTPVEEIAAHEYGHAIALARGNAWSGDAFRWGPEYWASYENVCARTYGGTAFPGNEGSYYTLNPSEAWAETNRLLNGGSPNLWGVSVSFFPDSTALQLAKRDILQPWNGYTRYAVTGRFRLHQSRSRSYSLQSPDDGRSASIKLVTHGSLRANLYLYDSASGRLVAKAAKPGRYEAVGFGICGGRRARVRVYRRSGYGSYTLQANIP